MDFEEKENHISMEYWNMKVNFCFIENGMEKDMIKMEI